MRRVSRWSTFGWVASVVVLGVVVVALSRGVGQSNDGRELTRSLARGEQPPAPELPSGEFPGSQAQPPERNAKKGYAGPVVLNFWASWCGPCREETPELMKLYDEFRDEGLVVVGANAQDSLSDAQGFAQAFDVHYPLVRATREDEQRWGVGGFPETFLIAPDGSIDVHIVGPLDAETLRASVEKRLR